MPIDSCLAHVAMHTRDIGMLEDDSSTGSDISTPLDDSILYLYTDNGGGEPSSSHVAYNDDGDDLPDGYNTYASRIVYTATYTGTHFAKMTPYSDGNAGSFDFIFDTTCLLSQENCDEDGGTFGTCSTVPGLTSRLKCITPADGYSVDSEGTVMISRTIECNRHHGGGKDFDRADDFNFCAAFVSGATLMRLLCGAFVDPCISPRRSSPMQSCIQLIARRANCACAAQRQRR